MCSKERGTWSRAFLSVSRLAMSLPCVPLSLLETLVSIPCSQVQAPLPKQRLVFSDSLASSVGAAHFNNWSKRLQFAKGVAAVSESNLSLCQHQNIRYPVLQPQHSQTSQLSHTTPRYSASNVHPCQLAAQSSTIQEALAAEPDILGFE